jgi:CPA1 family monovalent cation:H+ antiporter
LIAENIHVSGVIAVVTTGLMFSYNRDKLSEQVKTQSKSVWNTVVFILGGLVFILIGIEFPHVLHNIPADNILPLIGCAFLIFIVALIIRVFVIFWHKGRLEKRLDAVEKRFKDQKNKSNADKDIPQQDVHHRNSAYAERWKDLRTQLLFSWKEVLIIGWSGMRGIVSLAAAMSLPLLMEDGTAFPMRDTILFLTVAVVIIMLVVQGLGLPLLVKWLKIGKS